MKALTLTQPWASLVALRQKRVETRSWSTSFTGELAIHAAKGFPSWARETCMEPQFNKALSVEGANDLRPALTVGRVLCVVRLLGCRRTEDVRAQLSEQELAFGDYHDGRFAWFLEYLRPVEHQPLVRGALGLWEWAEG